MSPRIFITLAIIACISIGAGAAVFGILVAVLGNNGEKEATIIAIGVVLGGAVLGALVARLFGGFRELEEQHD